MNTWEGAELCFYMNGESCSIDLSNVQFGAIAKILGLQYDGAYVSYYSDETIIQLSQMKGNPFRLQEKK